MIFNERNDPNQISNLIDFNTREYKMTSNFSSNYSEISDNGNNERSFDINKQEDNNSLNESQVSEYAVQRTIPDGSDNKFSDYESHSSMFNLNFIKVENNCNNLDFLNMNHASNKNNEDMNVFGMNNNNNETENNNNIFNFEKSYSRKRNLMSEFDKYKEEENDHPKNIQNEILGSNKSNNEDLYVNTHNSEANNNIDNMVYINNICNTESSNVNFDTENNNYKDKFSKFVEKACNKQIPKIHNKVLMNNKRDMDSNMNNSVNNSNNSKVLKADPSVDDLIGNL
jgi:hypothetical protein